MKLEDGTVVLVPLEVYKAYWKLRNHQNYIERAEHEFIDEFISDEKIQSLHSDDDVEQAAENALLILLLRRSIKTLKPDEREIINMLFLDDDNLSLRAAAKKLGISHQALTKRLVKILYKLRKEIEDKMQ